MRLHKIIKSLHNIAFFGIIEIVVLLEWSAISKKIVKRGKTMEKIVSIEDVDIRILTVKWREHDIG